VEYVGDPINVTTGEKLAEESDYVGAGVFPLVLTRYYGSQSTFSGPLGKYWTHSYNASIRQLTPTVVEAVRADQSAYTFNLSNGGWKSDADVNSKLVQLTNSSEQTTGWRYTTEMTGRSFSDIAKDFDSLFGGDRNVYRFRGQNLAGYKLNYYFQGMLWASYGRSYWMMKTYIYGWKLIRYQQRPSAGTRYAAQQGYSDFAPDPLTNMPD